MSTSNENNSEVNKNEKEFIPGFKTFDDFIKVKKGNIFP